LEEPGEIKMYDSKKEAEELKEIYASLDKWDNEWKEKFFKVVGKRMGRNFLEKVTSSFCNFYFVGYFKGRENGKGVYINKEFHEKQEMDEWHELGINKIFKTEYVNQTRNGGYTGDDFAGTMAYKYKGKFLQFQYSC
jgi:hypothetical protein